MGLYERGGVDPLHSPRANLMFNSQGPCFKTWVSAVERPPKLEVMDRAMRSVPEHAVIFIGGGPTGLMLAGELALAGVDVAIVERRLDQKLASRRGGGQHARTIEIFDQRGIADRFLSQGQAMQVAAFSLIPLDISDFPIRHNYGLRSGRTRSSKSWPIGWQSCL